MITVKKYQTHRLLGMFHVDDPMKKLYQLLAILMIDNSIGMSSVTSLTGNILYDVNNDNNNEMIINDDGLGIGLSADHKLHVAGNGIITDSISIGKDMRDSANLYLNGTIGFSQSIISSNSILNRHSLVLVDSTIGDLTLSLPNAFLVVGRQYLIKKTTNSNNVHIVSQSMIDTYDQIDLVPSFRGYLKIISDGTQWHSISQSEGVFGVSSSETLWVYEGFQYTSVGEVLRVQPDGSLGDVDATGLSGTWSDYQTQNGGDMKMINGSLTFGDLTTSGNHVHSTTTSTNDGLIRSISANITTSDELWFSVLFKNTATDNGGFAITNQQPSNYQFHSTDNGSDGLAGVGWSVPGGTVVTPYAWDGASQIVGTDSVSALSLQLFVGKISWDTGIGGFDEYSLYTFSLNGGNIFGGTLSQIGSTLNVDIDQNSATEHLEFVNLSRKKNNIFYDEIRIGSSLEMVTPY